MSSATPVAGTARLFDTPSPSPLPRFSRESTLSESAFSSTGTSLVELRQSLRGKASHKLSQAFESQTSGYGSYLQGVKHLSTRYPHLKNCMTASRSNRHKYTIYDYEDLTLLKKTSHVSSQYNSLGPEDCHSTFRKLVTEYIPASLSRRLIVVEDLSTDLIETLGSELKVTPEFFEEHLINSGWCNGKYQDQDASSWSTRGMRKPYTSVRWLRPATLAISRLSAQHKNDLLKARGRLIWDESLPYPCSAESMARMDVRHEISPSVNIMRPSWNLKLHDEHE